MKSIKSKILCMVILPLLIASTLIGVSSYLVTHRIMHADADEILGAVCQEHAMKVNSILKNIEASVLVAGVVAESEISDPNQLKDDTFLAKYESDIDFLLNNEAKMNDGVFGYYLRFSPDLLGSEAGFFYNKNATTGAFYRLPPTDLSLYDPTDTEHVGWYYEAVWAEEPIWMSPYHNQNNNIKMISYVTPLYKGDVLIGVVGMDVELSLLERAIDDIKVYEHGFAYLVDADGNAVYSPSGEEIAANQTDGSYAEETATLNNGMRLTLRVAYQDIQRNSRPLLNSIIVITVVLLAVFTVIAVIVANRIINPLKQLTKMAQELANGKSDVKLKCDSKDEVGTLSRIFQDTAEKLQGHMSYINALAYRDSLTGVKNSAAYAEEVAEIEKRMNCGRPEFGVLVADINNLKTVNDTKGHDAGNQLIIQTARLLGRTFRYSPLYRIGGDEFLVILSGRDLENYRSRVKQFDEACAQNKVHIDDCEFVLSVARGVAVYNPKIDQTFSDVFRHADYSMYMHKQSIKKENP